MKKLEQLINMNKRRVLITGASGALGSVIAETLEELGASLILVDKKDSDLIKLEKKLYSFKNIDILPLSCDLENEIERN